MAGPLFARPPAPIRRQVLPCPICDARQTSYLFVTQELVINRCETCGLVSQGAALASKSPPPAGVPAEHHEHSATEQKALRQYLSPLANGPASSLRLLLITATPDWTAAQVRQAGFTSLHALTAGELQSAPLPEAGFDACLLVYQLERSADLSKTMDTVWTSLKPGGQLVLAAPTLDSWPARLLGLQWTEWRAENRFYFSRVTLQALLYRFGFEQLWVRPDRREYTIRHLYHRSLSFPPTVLVRAIQQAYRLTPRVLADLPIDLETSGMIVSARRGPRRARPLLSIIVPAYNEASTFAILMDGLLALSLDDLDREIIVVESNSTDGTRELALKYAAQPLVRLVLQEKALGKGNAVRAGLAEARGDLVIIQDADLEYDLNDYQALLAPLLHYQTAFVLGARHGGHWKMRQFADQPVAGLFLNLGHVLFATALNLLYGASLRDPFTMFKVFRRDCLHRLRLERNRFDFDFELVIKLLQKGYRPLEIPVNYRSRSFREGKKVSLWRDPLTWVVTLLRYRFVSPFEAEPRPDV